MRAQLIGLLVVGACGHAANVEIDSTTDIKYGKNGLPSGWVSKATTIVMGHKNDAVSTATVEYDPKTRPSKMSTNTKSQAGPVESDIAKVQTFEYDETMDAGLVKGMTGAKTDVTSTVKIPNQDPIVTTSLTSSTFAWEGKQLTEVKGHTDMNIPGPGPKTVDSDATFTYEKNENGFPSAVDMVSSTTVKMGCAGREEKSVTSKVEVRAELKFDAQDRMTSVTWSDKNGMGMAGEMKLFYGDLAGPRPVKSVLKETVPMSHEAAQMLNDQSCGLDAEATVQQFASALRKQLSQTLWELGVFGGEEEANSAPQLIYI